MSFTNPMINILIHCGSLIFQESKYWSLHVQHIFSKIVQIEKVIVQIDHEGVGNSNYNVK
jgi:hypothetical protein